MSDDIVHLRRFGSKFTKPCKRPDVTECAMLVCQEANECQLDTPCNMPFERRLQGEVAAKDVDRQHANETLRKELAEAWEARNDYMRTNVDLRKELAEANSAADKEMERVKACEHIADGDEGWERVRNLCPSTAAVARLQDRFTEAKAALANMTDAKKACHVCGDQTLWSCSDCQINLSATIYVCSKRECREHHDWVCSVRAERAEAELAEAKVALKNAVAVSVQGATYHDLQEARASAVARAEHAEAHYSDAVKDLREWRGVAQRAEAERDAMREREDKLLRAVIDETWGQALEDGSVPSTKLQDKIIAVVRAPLAPSPCRAGGSMSRDLAQALHELWMSMNAAMDQGHNHTIRVNPVMVEDVMAAEAIVRFFMARTERAEAEAKALREALQKIIDDYLQGTHRMDGGYSLHMLARAALAASPAGDKS